MSKVNGAQEHVEEVEIDIIEPSNLVVAQEHAAIDTQIATAKQYPRILSECREKLMEVACVDQEVAETMFYRLPRGGRTIEGPSVRFAEAIVYAWQNLRVDSRVVSIDEKFVTAQATAIDLERNNAQRSEVKLRITDKYGKRYNEDMIIMTSNAACSKAARNAVFKVVPFSLAKKAFEKAKLVSIGGDKPINQVVAEEIARWLNQGVDEKLILDKLGRRKLEDLTIDDVLTLKGMRNAIGDGDVTLEELFAPESGKADELQAKLAVRLKNKGQPTEASSQQGADTSVDDAFTQAASDAVAEVMSDD